MNDAKYHCTCAVSVCKISEFSFWTSLVAISSEKKMFSKITGKNFCLLAMETRLFMAFLELMLLFFCYGGLLILHSWGSILWYLLSLFTRVAVFLFAHLQLTFVVVLSFFLWKWKCDLLTLTFIEQISLDNFKSGRLHTLITCAFSHSDFDHLLTNMIGLYFFGSSVSPWCTKALFMLIFWFLNDVV